MITRSRAPYVSAPDPSCPLKSEEPRKFTQEYRDEAVLMVIQSQRPIAQVARELGINEGTLGTWLSKYRSEHPVTEELSLPDRAKLKELERENRELRLMNDFLKKAAAYFAREQQ